MPDKTFNDRLYRSFEFAFFNTKAYAAVLILKLQRFYRPQGQKEDIIHKIIETTYQTIGNTLYIIESTVSETAKETAYDKLKRMILNDSKNLTDKGEF